MSNFWDEISHQLQNVLGNSFEIHSTSTLSGGDINQVYKLRTSSGNFCIKVNDADIFPGMFIKEAIGLNLLKDHSTFTIPEVIHSDVAFDKAYLLLHFIDNGKKSENYWQIFGEKLAGLHQNTASDFGLDHDNFIGSLVQPNTSYDSWPEFFYNTRIEFQLEQAIAKNLMSFEDSRKANRLYQKLNELIPNEKPSLLHGDLWSGNAMTDEKGNPSIIDPAVYFGHREMDLAMTKLFGGFDSSMYEAYDHHYPLEKNWEDRLEIHNLYPLLVHVNIFGTGYVKQVRGILNKYA